MAWIYLAALGGYPWHSNLGCKPSRIVKTNRMLKPSYFQEWSRGKSNPHQFGMMSKHSRERCSLKSTSFSVVFPVKISALQEMVRAWQVSEADFSSKLSGLQKKLIHHLCFLKTCPQLELGDFEKSSEHLPIWGMTVDGRVYLPQALVPRTYEKDGFFWPTPVANDDNKSPEAHMAMKARMKGGARKKPTSLNVMVKGVERGMWPTPMARDWKGAGGKNRHSIDLPKAAGGQLNPTWVEWLMGYPLGWTDLEPWAMQWFRFKRKKLS